MSDPPVLNRRKFSVIDYHRMGLAGILSRGDRVELIDGELIEMVPIGQPHAGTVNRLTRAMVNACGRLAIVAVQNPLRLDRFNEPQPDLTILRPRADFYDSGPHAGPGDVLLLIEVSDTSLRADREVKLPLYARYGIPEVWIVNLVRRRVEVFRNPDNEGYNISAIHGPGDNLTLALAPDIEVFFAQVFGQMPYSTEDAS